MVQPTHQPDAVLTLRVTPELRARLARLLARVPSAGAARLSRHGLAVWCLEQGLLTAEADPATVLRAPSTPTPPTPGAPAVGAPSGGETPSREERQAPDPTDGETPPPRRARRRAPTSPPGLDADTLRARWRALVKIQRNGAEAVGVSQPWVSRWLAGERQATPETLARIASYLDTLAHLAK